MHRRSYLLWSPVNRVRITGVFFKSKRWEGKQPDREHRTERGRNEEKRTGQRDVDHPPAQRGEDVERQSKECRARMGETSANARINTSFST